MDAGHYPTTSPKLPVWEWVIVREDGRRFRFRCDFDKSIKTFAYTEWEFGANIKSPGPPSTGVGKDSIRRIDGDHYFQRTKSHYYGHGEKKPAGTASAGSSAGGTGTGGGGQPRGSGGDGPGSDNTRGSGSGGLGNGRGYRTDAENAKVGKGPQPSQQVASSEQVHSFGGGPAADDWGTWSGGGAVGQNTTSGGEWTTNGWRHSPIAEAGWPWNSCGKGDWDKGDWSNGEWGNGDWSKGDWCKGNWKGWSDGSQWN